MRSSAEQQYVDGVIERLDQCIAEGAGLESGLANWALTTQARRHGFTDKGEFRGDRGSLFDMTHELELAVRNFFPNVDDEMLIRTAAADSNYVLSIVATIVIAGAGGLVFFMWVRKKRVRS